METLGYERIPHHAVPSAWWDSEATVKLALVGLAAVVSFRSGARRDALFLVGAVAATALVTSVVIVNGSGRLLLTLPWRASCVIVPISFAIILGYIARRISEAARAGVARLATGAAAALLAVAFGLGLRSTSAHLLAAPERHSLVRAIRALDLRGVGLVPADAETVRLNARVRIYADWKSHPHVGMEVLEWAERVRLIDRFFSGSLESCALLDRFHEPLTWALIPPENPDLARCFPGWHSTALAGWQLLTTQQSSNPVLPTADKGGPSSGRRSLAGGRSSSGPGVTSRSSGLQTSSPANEHSRLGQGEHLPVSGAVAVGVGHDRVVAHPRP